MEADFYFRMGSTHAICQDYALAGRTADGTYYAVLSDGCSGTPIKIPIPGIPTKALPVVPGSPYTDFGARFLTLAALKHLDEMKNGIFPAEPIIRRAEAVAHQGELPQQALDATLLVAITTDSGYLHTYQTGDGVVVHRFRDGGIKYASRQFGNNSPYYLSYLLSKSREQQLLRPDPSTMKPEEMANAGTVEETHGWFDPQTKTWGKTSRRLSLETEASQVNQSTVSSDDVEVTMLLSDGVSSFQLKNGLPIPLETVLEQIMAIKGFQGEFLTRRCNRFLQSFCAEQGWQHADDFSAAAIYHGSPRQ
jgi:hypothetical protein